MTTFAYGSTFYLFYVLYTRRLILSCSDKPEDDPSQLSVCHCTSCSDVKPMEFLLLDLRSSPTICLKTSYRVLRELGSKRGA